MSLKTCPLCSSSATTRLDSFPSRQLARCSNCDLVFVNAIAHLPDAAERARYELHRNSIDDIEYVAFLARLADPICKMRPIPANILDYGSGPNPVLAELLRSRGYDVQIYDPHFAPNTHVLTSQYVIVLCSETAEHFRDVASEWKKMINCLRAYGVLGVMTLLHDENTDWSRWWYAHDPTHTCFYSTRTMMWIGKHFGLATSVLDKRVTVFHK